MVRHVAAILVLCTTIWFLYAPATNRVFAMDQISYFAELEGDTSLAAGLRHYDYAATRRYEKGDDALFRPLLFTWLAVANSTFAYRHVWWNVATLALHMLVVLALYWLLVTLQPSGFAFLVALLFAVMKPLADLVLWNHLGGYILAWFCLLIALRAFILIDRSPDRLRALPLTVFVLAFGAAVFFHESMVPLSLVAATLILIRARRQLRAAHIAGLFAPAVVYAITYIFHLSRVARPAYVDSGGRGDVFGAGRLLTAIPRTLGTLSDWTAELVLPSALQFKSEAFARLSTQFDPSADSVLHWWNVVLAAAVAIIATTAVSRQRFQTHWRLLVLVAAAAVIYAGIICLGRTREETLAVGYYLYFFSLLAVVFAYAAVGVSTLRGLRALAGCTGMVLLIGLHVKETRAVVNHVAETNRAASTYLRAIERFIDQHKHEPDFSFATLRSSPRVDPEVVMREGYPDDPSPRQRHDRLSEILFKRYYNRLDPKYVPF